MTTKKTIGHKPGMVPATPHWATLVHKTVDVATGYIDSDGSPVTEPKAIVEYSAFDSREDWENAIQKLFADGAKFSAIHVDGVANITATVNINIGI